MDENQTINMLNTKLEVLQIDIGYIKTALDKIENIINEKYVTRIEFEPIRNLVYGVVSLILMTVIGAILMVIIK